MSRADPAREGGRPKLTLARAVEEDPRSEALWNGSSEEEMADPGFLRDVATELAFALADAEHERGVWRHWAAKAEAERDVWLRRAWKATATRDEVLDEATRQGFFIERRTTD